MTDTDDATGDGSVPGTDGGEGRKRRLTTETEIALTDDLELDEVFVRSMADTEVLDIETEDDIVTRCEIDPRVLRSAFFLYSSMERTRHDWR